MKLRIINPNTTAAMTATLYQAASNVAASGTVIECVTSATGPASIEGYYDEAMSLPGLLRAIAEGEARCVDAHIIACFDDSGLEAARQRATAPVIGIGEAAMVAAALLGTRFTVITTLSRSIPALELNVLKYGFERRARVRACDIAVLALEEPGSDARGRIDAEIARARQDDRAEVIVLGCAGMARLVSELSAVHGLPVVDGVTAAVKLAEMLVSLRLRTSKIGGYQWQGTKQLTGAMAQIMGD